MPGFEGDIHGNAFVAVLLAMIQVFEHLGFDQEGAAAALLARRLHQRHHPARVVLQAAMVVRALPETPRPAGDVARPALEKGEILLPDQRAVAEDPGGLGDGHGPSLRASSAVCRIRP